MMDMLVAYRAVWLHGVLGGMEVGPRLQRQRCNLSEASTMHAAQRDSSVGHNVRFRSRVARYAYRISVVIINTRHSTGLPPDQS